MSSVSSSNERDRDRLLACERAFRESEHPGALLEAIHLAGKLNVCPSWLAVALDKVLRTAWLARRRPRRGPFASPRRRLMFDLEHLYRAGVVESAHAELGLPWDKAYLFASWYLSGRPRAKPVTERAIRYSHEVVRRWGVEEPHRTWLFSVEDIAAHLDRAGGGKDVRAWLKENYPKVERVTGSAPAERFSPFILGWALPGFTPS